MISGVLADEVDDRHLGPARVMQIRETVGETGAEMQQGARRLFSHPRIAVGRSGHDAFEEAQYAANFRCAVQRGNNVNFRCAWVGKTSVDGSSNQGAN